MKIASITVDECVQIRIALSNAEINLRRFIKQDMVFKQVYEDELRQVIEAKKMLANALQRDP
jgi:hypothetical protein